MHALYLKKKRRKTCLVLNAPTTKKSLEDGPPI
jgi:hypothetical protein